MVLGVIIYLQIDGSVSADEFLMGMHIREPGAQANRALSPDSLDMLKFRIENSANFMQQDNITDDKSPK